MIILGSVTYNDSYFKSDNVKVKLVTNYKDVFECDALVLWGGEDISPWFYDEKPVYTSAPQFPSKRDASEAAICKVAAEVGIPVLAICRGAQFLCCLNGGKLWQDVNNHGGNHRLHVYGEDRTFTTTSTHHQMMRPASHHKLLGFADLSTIKLSEHESLAGQDPNHDAEIVLIPNVGLCVQGHPEYMPKHHEFPQLVIKLFHQHFGIQL